MKVLLTVKSPCPSAYLPLFVELKLAVPALLIVISPSKASPAMSCPLTVWFPFVVIVAPFTSEIAPIWLNWLRSFDRVPAAPNVTDGDPALWLPKISWLSKVNDELVLLIWMADKFGVVPLIVISPPVRINVPVIVLTLERVKLVVPVTARLPPPEKLLLYVCEPKFWRVKVPLRILLSLLFAEVELHCEVP